MLKEYLLDFIFPTECFGCKKILDSGNVLCEGCYSKIPIRNTLICGECRARLPGITKICHKDFPYILGYATDYDDPLLHELVHSLKFQFVKNASIPLANLLSDYISKFPDLIKNFTVVPIPLSSFRIKNRGFNQAELIGRHLAQNFNLPLEADILKRVKNTSPQSELGFKERRKNVVGCFALKEAPPKNILLIDDVVTSGATFFEAAKVLKSGGARKIFAIAACGA